MGLLNIVYKKIGLLRKPGKSGRALVQPTLAYKLEGDVFLWWDLLYTVAKFSDFFGIEI